MAHLIQNWKNTSTALFTHTLCRRKSLPEISHYVAKLRAINHARSIPVPEKEVA